MPVGCFCGSGAAAAAVGGCSFGCGSALPAARALYFSQTLVVGACSFCMGGRLLCCVLLLLCGRK